MKVIEVDSLLTSERKVDCPKGNFTSLRILLEEDGMGYTMTRTYIRQGGPYRWHYKNHLETCYCISGCGILVDLTTRVEHMIYPGIVYALDKHDLHEFHAIKDTILICIFNPPLKGKEVHKEDGSY